MNYTWETANKRLNLTQEEIDGIKSKFRWWMGLLVLTFILADFTAASGNLSYTLLFIALGVIAYTEISSLAIPYRKYIKNKRIIT
jgi:hypothetical protein